MIKKLIKLLHIFGNLFYLKFFLKTLIAPSIEHSKVLKKIKYNFLIDAGFNKGQFSLVSKKYNNTVPILAFEPLKNEYSKNLYLLNKFNDIEVINCALGNSNTKIDINICNRTDSSSILLPKNISNFYDIVVDHHQNIKIRKLDNYISKFKEYSSVLLKVDVQGYELFLLKGALKSLKYVKWILIELSYSELYEKQPLANDIISLLKKSDFHVLGIHNKIKKKNKLIQADYLFEKK